MTSELKKRSFANISSDTVAPDPNSGSGKNSVKDSTCDECGLVCKTKRNLREHKHNKHSDEKPFLCDKCSFTCKNASNLRSHKKFKHSDEKPVLCNYCNYTCKNASALQAHKKNKHSGEKPVLCDECDYACKRASTLRVHKKYKHSDVRPFLCDECGYACKIAAELQSHKKNKHSDVKPVLCDECAYACKRASTLRVHKKYKHSDVRPFLCDECGYACKSATNLRAHKYTHCDAKPYVCEQKECDSLAFKQKKSLTAHWYSWHTEEGQKQRKQQEERIARLFDKHGIEAVRENWISFNCIDSLKKCARLDFVVATARGVFCVEVDEDQHDGYGVSCDLSRMFETHSALQMGAGGREPQPLIWIRYNPHACKVDGETRRFTKKERETELLNVLHTYTPPAGQEMTIIYMYYNCVTVTERVGLADIEDVGDGLEPAYDVYSHLEPVIFSDPEYHEFVKELVQPPIVPPKQLL